MRFFILFREHPLAMRSIQGECHSSAVTLILHLGMCALLLGLAGCSSDGDVKEKPTTPARAIKQVDWAYEKKAILLDFDADKNLNYYNGDEHTLALGVFQVSEMDQFLKLLKHPDKVKEMLETGKSEETILQFDRYVISPGYRSTAILDRAKGSKLVGVVAGYFNFNPLNDSRLFEIPADVKSEGIFSKTYSATPGVLGAHLFLGAQNFTDAKTLLYDADKEQIVEVDSLDSLRDPEVTLTSSDIKKEYDDFEPARKLGQ